MTGVQTCALPIWQRIENEQQELKMKKLAAKTGKFQGRDAALEAEA